MKLEKFLFFLIAVIFLTIGITSLFYAFYVIKDVKEVDVTLRVSDYIGLNVDSDAIKFGTIPPGNSGTKTFTLKNEYKMPLKTDIKIFGDVAKFVYISENYFWLQPGESKTIDITATVPNDVEFGEYKGKIRVLLKRF